MDQEFPKPNKKGWEERYRYAKAYEAAVASIMNFIISLESQLESLKSTEKNEENFDEA